MGWEQLEPARFGDELGVSALAVSGSDLYAGGGFEKAGGKISPYLPRARVGSKSQALTASNGMATLRFSGVTGYPYDVQRATNLTPPVAWTTVSDASLYPAADGSFAFTDHDAPRGTTLYRAACTWLPGCPKLDVQQPAGTSLINGISTIDFGAVAVGSRLSKTFTITNSGTDALSFAEIYAEDDFGVDSTGMLASVPSGGSTTFTVTFSPAVAGNRASHVYLNTNGVEGCNDGEGDWFTITLTGTWL